MNKTELIESIAERADVSKATAEKTLAATIETITKALVDNGAVNIVGLGSFTARARAARAGRNPSTGAAIQIGASVVPVFKAGKALKDAVSIRLAEEA